MPKLYHYPPLPDRRESPQNQGVITQGLRDLDEFKVRGGAPAGVCAASPFVGATADGGRRGGGAAVPPSGRRSRIPRAPGPRGRQQRAGGDGGGS